MAWWLVTWLVTAFVARARPVTRLSSRGCRYVAGQTTIAQPRLAGKGPMEPNLLRCKKNQTGRGSRFSFLAVVWRFAKLFAGGRDRNHSQAVTRWRPVFQSAAIYCYIFRFLVPYRKRVFLRTGRCLNRKRVGLKTQKCQAGLFVGAAAGEAWRQAMGESDRIVDRHVGAPVRGHRRNREWDRAG